MDYICLLNLVRFNLSHPMDLIHHENFGLYDLFYFKIIRMQNFKPDMNKFEMLKIRILGIDAKIDRIESR